MAHIEKRSDSERTRAHNGVLSDFERLVFFIIGTVVGVVAGRATAPRQKTEKAVLVAEPTLLPVAERSALPQSDTSSEQRAHEASDVNLPVLGMILALLLVGAFVIHASLWWWVNASRTAGIDDAPRGQATAQRLPQSQHQFPKLQLSPQGDLQEFLAREQQQLRGSGPRNQTSGLARIPIERAMEIVADRGAPKWKTDRQISPLPLQQWRATDAQKNIK